MTFALRKEHRGDRYPSRQLYSKTEKGRSQRSTKLGPIPCGRSCMASVTTLHGLVTDVIVLLYVNAATTSGK